MMEICLNTNCPFYRDCDHPERCTDKAKITNKTDYIQGYNNKSYVNYTTSISSERSDIENE